MELMNNVRYVGAQHPDRKLFDALIPLPEGTSYNAYLVQGEKVALIDTVDPSKWDVLKGHLHGLERLDYVIANHAEQDHSGSLPLVLEMFPSAKIVTNKTCMKMLIDLLVLKEDDFLVIADGETLDLGGKTLRFIFTPWVHWPETMVTYLEEDRILFSCDFFGSHKAQEGYADESVMPGAKRYYAEIMMPFRKQIQKNLEKLKGMDIRMIAPSHGPVYKEPGMIMQAYREWSSEETKPEVLLAYVSMHDSTRMMAERLRKKLGENGVKAYSFDLEKDDIGELASELVDSAAVVIGSPTVLGGAHPAAMNAAYLANLLNPKTRIFATFGSYGWAPVAHDKLTKAMTNFRGEVLDAVTAKGMPRESELLQMDMLADTITKKLEVRK